MPAMLKLSIGVRIPLRILAFLSFVAWPAAAQTAFDPGCPLPFGDLKSIGRPVDKCSIQGVGTTESQLAQNRQKNNLCLTTPVVPITQLSFQKLQAKVEQKGIPFGDAQHLPTDRSVLRSLYTTSSGDMIGEGTLVAYVGYVLNAHFSDVSDGESVNCKMLGKVNNDIHITLASSPNASPCAGIVAEIIPHFRPLAWEDIVNTPRGHPLLIIGQLFFDASHRPCRPGKAASPPRISIWEIHPIYHMYVCRGTTPAQCQGANPQDWIPFEQLSNMRSSDELYR
jgi:hypothetical protein